MQIIIYSRDSSDGKLKEYCYATRKPTTGNTVTFVTQEWLPIRLGLTYHVAVAEKEDRPVKFREFSVDRHPRKEPPYTYTVELGQEWSGSVQMPKSSDEESSEPDAKQKPGNT